MSGIVVLTRPSHGMLFVILNLLCIFWKSIDFGKTRLQQTTQHRYRKVCGIMIGSQWFSCALPSVGGIDVFFCDFEFIMHIFGKA
jgi:hypothetical protein